MRSLGTLDVNQTPVLELLGARGRDRGVTGDREEDVWGRCGLGREKQMGIAVAVDVKVGFGRFFCQIYREAMFHRALKYD